jgi:hypothetical protein
MQAVPTAINEHAPSLFGIHMVNPNPFNPGTSIQYGIDTAQPVRLILYNVSGQAVATLVDGYQEAGRYQVDWQPAGLASGVYVAVLRAGGRVDVERITLIK